MSQRESGPLELYLRDLVILLKEQAFEAKEAERKATDENERAFRAGRLMAYHDVISLMQQQAEAFAIGLDELGLDQIQPERDLV